MARYSVWSNLFFQLAITLPLSVNISLRGYLSSFIIFLLMQQHLITIGMILLFVSNRVIGCNTYIVINNIVNKLSIGKREADSFH